MEEKGQLRESLRKDQKASQPKRTKKRWWTREEDEKLRKLVADNGTKNWKRIASFLEDRTDVQCLHRWQKVLNPGIRKGWWTNEEDQKLRGLVEEYGPKQWSKIASHFEGRIGKQCRERWFNHLASSLKEGEWTSSEVKTLVFAYSQLGANWSLIKKLLPGRSEAAIKMKRNSTLLKNEQKEELSGGQTSSQKQQNTGSQADSKVRAADEITHDIVLGVEILHFLDHSIRKSTKRDKISSTTQFPYFGLTTNSIILKSLNPSLFYLLGKTVHRSNQPE